MATFITVDGEQIKFPSGRHPVINVLKASGLSAPSRYDLLRIETDGRHVATHRVGDIVAVDNKDAFITARISTATA